MNGPEWQGPYIGKRFASAFDIRVVDYRLTQGRLTPIYALRELGALQFLNRRMKNVRF